MMTDAQLKARDARRNIGAELLESVRQMKAGQVGRSTCFEPLPDGSMRRTVTGPDGAVQSTEVLTGPKWQRMVTRSQPGSIALKFQ